jgi:NAD(P)-dependent dehydrogenase (short-subunit alcohol dehydrogenase family)
MMTDLKDKVVLVTGGGQGLGAAICEVLAEAGARVLPADIRKTAAGAVAKRVGGGAAALALDVRDVHQAEAVMRQVVAEFGRLDVLINNAGTDVTKSILELSNEEIDRVLDVNLRGPFALSKLAFAAMKPQGRGHIVNIVSTAAKRHWANASAYHASKWGLLGLSHALLVEGREYGIKVSAVVAGGMKTPFILDRFPEAEPNLQDPRNVAETVRFVLTQPEETIVPEVMVLPMRETSWP